MLKKIIIAAICLTMFLSVPVFALNYDTTGAFEECYTLYPEFIDSIIAEGTTEAKIIRFMDDVRDYLLKLPEELTEGNIDKHIYDAINEAFKYRWNIGVRDALMAAYPDAVTKAMDGIISEEFLPIYETVKRYILGISTPVITLSGKDSVSVHYVYMPEDKLILVGFYESDGTLVKAVVSPQGEMEPCGDYAVAYAFSPSSLSPICNKYMLKF
ncbi:MAG: hypothetical protein ACI3XA_05965 [Clostridia bacterium]